MQKIELCCEICQAKFNANYNLPKVLTCGHTVCSKCVERMKDKNLNKCPFDRKVLDFEDDKIAINYYILSLIDNSVEKNLVTLTEEDEEFTLNPKPVINSPGWKNTLDGFIKGNVMYTVETNGFIYCTDLKTGEWWFMYHNQFFGNFCFQVEDNMYLIDQYGSLFQIFNKNYYVQLGKKNVWKNTTHLTVFNNKVFTIEATNKFFETTLKNGKYKEIVITKDNINLNPAASLYFNNNSNTNKNIISSNNNNSNNLIFNNNNNTCNNNKINSKVLKNNNPHNHKYSNNKSGHNCNIALQANVAVSSTNSTNISSIHGAQLENKENISINNVNTKNNINNLKRVKFLDKLNGNNPHNKLPPNNPINYLEKPAIVSAGNAHTNSHSSPTTSLVNLVGIPSNINIEHVNISQNSMNQNNGNINLNNPGINFNYLSSEEYETKIFKNITMLFSTKKLIFFANKSGELFSYNDKNKEIKLVKTNFYKNIESYSANCTHVYFFEKNSKIIYRMDISYSEKDKEKDLFSEDSFYAKHSHNHNSKRHKNSKKASSPLNVKDFPDIVINPETNSSQKNISNEVIKPNTPSKIEGLKMDKNIDNLINRNLKNNNCINNINNVTPSSSSQSKSKNNSKKKTSNKNKENEKINLDIIDHFNSLEINANNNKNEKNGNKNQSHGCCNSDKTSQSQSKSKNKKEKGLENDLLGKENLYCDDEESSSCQYEYIDSDIINSDDEGNELYIEITNPDFLNVETFINLETIHKDLTPIKVICSNHCIVIIDKIGEIYNFDINSKSHNSYQCLFMLRNCHLSNSSIIGDGDLLLLDPIRLSLNKLNILAGTEVIVLHSSKFLYTIKNIFSANSRIYFIDVSGNLYYFNEVDKKLTQIGNNGICKYILDLAVCKNFLLTIENNTLYRTSLSDGNYIEIKNDYVKNYEYFFADNANVIFISKDDEVQVLTFNHPVINNNPSNQIVGSSSKNVNTLNLGLGHDNNQIRNSACGSISQPVSSSNIMGKINGNSNQLYLKTSFKYENISRMHSLTYFRNHLIYYNIKTSSVEAINLEDNSHKVMIENFAEVSQFINNNDFLACILKNGVIYKLYC